MTIKKALEYGIEKLKLSEVEEPISKTRLILAFAISQNKEYLITHDLEILRRRSN